MSGLMKVFAALSLSFLSLSAADAGACAGSSCFSGRDETSLLQLPRNKIVLGVEREDSTALQQSDEEWPDWLTKAASSIKDSAMEHLSSAKAAVTEILNKHLETIKGLSKDIVEKANKGLTDAVATAAKGLKDFSEKASLEVSEGLEKEFAKLIKKTEESSSSLLQVQPAEEWPDFGKHFRALKDAVKGIVKEHLDTIKGLASDIVDKANKGLGDAVATAAAGLQNFSDKAAADATKKLEEAFAKVMDSEESSNSLLQVQPKEEDEK